MVQGPWIIAQPFKFADKVFPIVFKQRYQLLGLTKWTIETCSSLMKQSYTNLVRIFAFLHSRLTMVSVTGTGGKGSGWHAVFVGGHCTDFLCGEPTVGTHMGFTCHGWDCAWIFIPRPSSYRISGVDMPPSLLPGLKSCLPGPRLGLVRDIRKRPRWDGNSWINQSCQLLSFGLLHEYYVTILNYVQDLLFDLLIYSYYHGKWT